MRHRFVAGGLLAAMSIACACGNDTQGGRTESGSTPARAAARSSQILVTVDAVATRHLALYGGPVRTPRLDALGAAGITYDDATSVAPQSRPALVSILTGVPPDRSGVRDNIHDALPDGIPTLAEAAHASGFETAAFVGTPFASYSSGLQRGFDLFDGPEAIVIGPAQHAPKVTSAGDLADHVKKWLASRQDGKPVFAWIHLADLNGLSVLPLASSGVPKNDHEATPQADYDKALAAVDAAIGAIVDAFRDDTRVGGAALTIVGTHGTYLGEGGRYGDGFWLSDETLRVPLVRLRALSASATGSSRHEPRPTWIPDVAATIARELGTKLGGRSEGVALDEPASPSRLRLAWAFALDDQLALPPRTAVRQDRGFAVFETKGDGRLVAVERASEAAPDISARAAAPRRRILDEAHRRAIEHAGLRVGSSAATADWPAKPDEWLSELQLMRVYFGSERPGVRWQTRIVLERAPDSLAALVARLYWLSTSSPEVSGPAVAVRDKLLALYPNRSDALHWAAHLSLADKHLDAAAALLDAAIAVGPVEPEIYYDQACVEARQGNAAAALAGLGVALRAGYRNWDWIDKDPDLAAIRTSPGFGELVRAHGR